VKQAVVTADDFGRHPQVNRAVVSGHTGGILTAASLMVTASAARQAVAIAKRHPSLGVGLHLVLADGRAVLGRSEIPLLVDASGRFARSPALAGLNCALSRQAARQTAAECRAQLETFLATGLTPDHLNCHHHLHIHPVVAAIVAELAVEYRIPAVRLPLPPVERPMGRAAMVALMLPWSLWLRRRLRGRGVAHNQVLFGLYETGRMDEHNWLRLIPQVKPGLSEFFCHPSASPAAHDRGPQVEWRALISSRVKSAMAHAQIRLTTFRAQAQLECRPPSTGVLNTAA